MSEDRDPRWEWVEVTTLGDTAPRYIKGRCNHLEIVPVHAQDELGRALGGDAGPPVAYLCLTCDAQLPEEWA